MRHYGTTYINLIDHKLTRYRILVIYTALRAIMSYTISLQDAPSGITEQAKAEAEHRFQRTLERALGTEEEVIEAYRAWQTAEETAETELSNEEITLVKRWIAAATRAQHDGFRELGESEAYFEIRVDR